METNPLLGFVTQADTATGVLIMANLEKSTAELDLQERSTKKVKEGSTSLVDKGVSFRDIIAGRCDDNIEEE